MGKIKKKNQEEELFKEVQEEPQEQVTEETEEITQGQDQTSEEGTEPDKPNKPEESEEKPVQFSAKQFVKKLKSEVTGVPKRVFDAFIKVVPPVDTEVNYQKIWKTTFKRQ